MAKDAFPDFMGEEQSSCFLSTCCLLSRQPYSLGILSLICPKENPTLNLPQGPQRMLACARCVCFWGWGGEGEVAPLPTFLPGPLLPLQPLGRAEGGSSCWGVSLPRPVALPDVGPPPSHVTRPGHKKEVSTSVIASWNSDSATSPKTGCAWRAGCEQRGPGCPFPPPLSPQLPPSISV